MELQGGNTAGSFEPTARRQKWTATFPRAQFGSGAERQRGGGILHALRALFKFKVRVRKCPRECTRRHTRDTSYFTSTMAAFFLNDPNAKCTPLHPPASERECNELSVKRGERDPTFKRVPPVRRFYRGGWETKLKNEPGHPKPLQKRLQPSFTYLQPSEMPSGFPFAYFEPHTLGTCPIRQ